MSRKNVFYDHVGSIVRTVDGRSSFKAHDSSGSVEQEEEDSGRGLGPL